MKRISLILVLASTLAVVTFLILRDSGGWRFSRGRNASLLWLGVTNVADRGPHAILCFTNATPVYLIFIPDCIEWTVSGVWTNTPLTGLGRRHLDDWIGLQEDSVKPGGGFVFLVPPPAGQAVWRVRFNCQQRDPIRDAVAEFEIRLKDTNAAVHQTRTFSGRSYVVTTPEISQ